MLLRKNLFACCLLGFLHLSPTAASSLSPIECPGKSVNEIRQQAEQYEVSFLFYHVAWSNDSQTARVVYDQIAPNFRERIYFAVIDCYHLACNCSKTYPLSLGSGSPSRWPTLIIRYGHRIALQYNGEWTFDAVKRLIGALYKPVERLHTREELKQLMTNRDAVVLGVFDNDSQLEYRVFVSASIKWLETDPEMSFRFATAIGAAGKDILNRAIDSKPSVPQILLITTKSIDVVSIEWNVSNIVLKLQTDFVRSLSILYGYNSPKSLTINVHLSPVIAIVANDYFYEYMDTVMSNGNSLNKSCSTNYWHCEIVQLQELGHVKYTLEKNVLLYPLKCIAKEYVSLWNLRYYYALDRYLKKFVCSLRHDCSYEYESYSAIKIQSASPIRKIATAKYLKKFVETNWADFKSEQNQSLSVVILDDTKHMDFLKTQGIPHADASNIVTMIIADRLKESIFVYQNVFTYDTLQQFVRSYYSKNLVAYKSCSSTNTKPPFSQSKIFIENVNHEMFSKKVDQNNLTTIALLFSPQCMFSALASQILIQLSAMLDDSSGIQIIRINTLWNDLPWEFKISNTPTLIVFPRGRASDSRVFPMHLKFNVHNVFSFVLAQMEPVDQFKTLLSCCKRRKLNSLRMRKCLQYVRKLAAQHYSGSQELQKTVEDQITTEKMVEWNDLKLQLKTIFPLY